MNTIKKYCYDIGIAWTWEYDEPFVQLIERLALQRSLSVFQITRENIFDTIEMYKERKIWFRFFFDRASDEDDTFLHLANMINEEWKRNPFLAPHPINPLERLKWASDKATMHLEFMSNGIHVPYTIIISPFADQQEVHLSVSELAQLGRPFIIKPANTTGGGVGVVMGAETLAHVLEARKTYSRDKYLLQETIVPVELDGMRAWFRSFYAFGEVFLCWWNDQTHIYRSVTADEEERYGLQQLRTATLSIAQLSGLDFFSSELAFTRDSRLVAVDYINEMCDMRFQSQHPDGVPDEIIIAIVKKFLDMVEGKQVNMRH